MGFVQLVGKNLKQVTMPYGTALMNWRKIPEGDENSWHEIEEYEHETTLILLYRTYRVRREEHNLEIVKFHTQQQC